MAIGDSRGSERSESPISIEIEMTPLYRWIRIAGVLTDEALMDGLTSIWNAADYDPNDPEIYDFGEAQARDVTRLGLAAVARETSRIHAHVEGTLVAIVAPSNLSFGLGRQYGSVAENDRNTLNVFRDLSSAERWIQIESR